MTTGTPDTPSPTPSGPAPSGAPGAYRYSTDPGAIQFQRVFDWLRSTYWSPRIRPEVVRRAIDNSIVIGAYLNCGTQVAFARVVTDQATFAWLCDVFVDPAHRGRGISKQLVAHLLADPRLVTLRRWALATADAHALYARFGFGPVPAERWMERKSDPSAWSEAR